MVLQHFRQGKSWRGLMGWCRTLMHHDLQGRTGRLSVILLSNELGIMGNLPKTVKLLKIIVRYIMRLICLKTIVLPYFPADYI
jgi:hypothetical protein